MKPIKKDGATPLESCSPFVKPPVQQYKDTSRSSQKFRILRLHFGIYDILHAYLSESNLGGSAS